MVSGMVPIRRHFREILVGGDSVLSEICICLATHNSNAYIALGYDVEMLPLALTAAIAGRVMFVT